VVADGQLVDELFFQKWLRKAAFLRIRLVLLADWLRSLVFLLGYPNAALGVFAIVIRVPCSRVLD
jgi:hypothetical protein